jgi:hypothetical protein
MPSTPKAGIVNKGKGENIFNPIESSGFLSMSAIRPEVRYRNIENARPIRTKTLLILLTKCFPCPCVKRGIK